MLFEWGKWLLIVAAIGYGGISANKAEAGHRLRTSCYNCGSGYGAAPVACASPAYQLVERTILVPETTWETRIVNVTVCKPEVRRKTVNVTRAVPEQQQVNRTVV